MEQGAPSWNSGVPTVEKGAPEVKRGALKGGALEMALYTVALEVQHRSRNSKGRGGT